MEKRSDIEAIQVTLLVSGEPSLFVMLASDGTINRMGTGSVSNAERDLFIGKTDPILFTQVREKIALELLSWCGRQLEDPQPKGKVCDLTVGFQRSNGPEMSTEWTYGSESQGPPREVCEFVVAVVAATELWYMAQKRHVQDV